MNKSLPARRVYYDWDEDTNPDAKLRAAFERTNPGFVDEDEPTLVYWALPVLGVLVAGFFVGRWWLKRTPSAVTAIAGEEDLCGFDLLGYSP